MILRLGPLSARSTFLNETNLPRVALVTALITFQCLDVLFRRASGGYEPSAEHSSFAHFLHAPLDFSIISKHFSPTGGSV